MAEESTRTLNADEMREAGIEISQLKQSVEKYNLCIKQSEESLAAANRVVQERFGERLLAAIGFITDSQRTVKQKQFDLEVQKTEKQGFLLDLCAQEGEVDQRIRNAFVVLKEAHENISYMLNNPDEEFLRGRSYLGQFLEDSIFDAPAEESSAEISLEKLAAFRVLKEVKDFCVDPEDDRSECPVVHLSAPLGLALEEVETILNHLAQRKEESILNA